MSTILWYNTIMDKLAYHLNKKKDPAKTEGKFLYYYPCDSSNNPDVQIGGNDYIVIEVSEQEWEALIEMDRFEYNNTHKFQRHTYGFPDVDEDTLSSKEQEKRIRKDISFTDILHEKSDKDKLVGRLSKKEQLVVKLSDKDYTQAEIAEELGVTQGYVSTTLKKANAKTDQFEIEKATPDEIVWKYWFMLIDLMCNWNLLFAHSLMIFYCLLIGFIVSANGFLTWLCVFAIYLCGALVAVGVCLARRALASRLVIDKLTPQC